MLGTDPEHIAQPGRCHHCDHFDHIIGLLEALVSGQASIDAAVAAINDSVTSLNADVTAIEALLAAGTVNTDALDAALPPLAAAVNAVNALATPAS
jgi:gamma-glutamyl phosphate reductase